MQYQYPSNAGMVTNHKPSEVSLQWSQFRTGPTSLVVPRHHANPTRCRSSIGFMLECHTIPILPLHLLQNWSLTYDKTIFHVNLWENAVWPMINLHLDLWQNYTLTCDGQFYLWKIHKKFTCDKNAVWPVTNSHVELWQKHTLTYDKTIQTNLLSWTSIFCGASG